MPPPFLFCLFVSLISHTPCHLIAMVRVWRRKGEGVRPSLFSMSVSGCLQRRSVFLATERSEFVLLFVFSRGEVLCCVF